MLSYVVFPSPLAFQPLIHRKLPCPRAVRASEAKRLEVGLALGEQNMKSSRIFPHLETFGKFGMATPLKAWDCVSTGPSGTEVE